MDDGEVLFLPEDGARQLFGNVENPTSHLPHIYRPVAVGLRTGNC